MTTRCERDQDKDKERMISLHVAGSTRPFRKRVTDVFRINKDERKRKEEKGRKEEGVLRKGLREIRGQECFRILVPQAAVQGR